MTERISLAEAYNNKDVVTQIAILKDKLDSIPDADLTNVVLKTGDQVINGEKTFNDPIVANGGVVFANNGIHVNGTLEVDGDIIQNGSAYETHAEQVFSKNDLIVTREDAIGGIAAGQLSGIRVKKYDGVSDLNLGVDANGVMRVGDVGSEQPLMTRDESADLTDGDVLVWNATDWKAVGVPIDTTPTLGSNAPITSGAVYNNVIDRINGASGITNKNVNFSSESVYLTKKGKVVTLSYIMRFTGVVSAGGTLFNIPAGFRPPANIPVIIHGMTANVRNILGEIDANGNVRNSWGTVGTDTYYGIFATYTVD